MGELSDALGPACRQLRQLAYSLPPGSPERRQLLADLTCLKVRLMALPARVASHAPFDDAEQAREAMDREIEAAFSDVRKWMR
jgi:hypothetical protein